MSAGFEDFLGELPLPTARSAFRADLRRRFADGSLTAAGPAPERGSLRPEAPADERPPAPRRRPRLLTPLLAAAAVVLAFLGLRALQGATSGPLDPSWVEGPAGTPATPWRVAYLGEQGPIRVDGREVAPTEVGALVGELLSGESPPRIESCDCRLLLSWNDELVIEVAEGTDLRTAALTAGASEPAAFELDSGEVLVRTAHPFDAGSLLFRTPQAEVLVTGTTLGVATNEFTCVCVCEGEVLVTNRATGEASAVHGDHTRLVHADGRVEDVRFDQVAEAHARPLRKLHEQDLQALLR